MARQCWVNEMATRLAERGYGGYRRSDAMAIRLLLRQPVAIGRLGAALGVTRQAARKVVDGLQQRGYASTERDERDSRQLNVVLTPTGEGYARTVVAVIEELNRRVCEQLTDTQMLGADAMLRAVIGVDEHWSSVARRLPSPPQHAR